MVLRIYDANGRNILYPHPQDNTAQRVEDGLWIGNYISAENESFLRANNITHIVSAIGEPRLGKRCANVDYLIMDFDDANDVNVQIPVREAHLYIKRARDAGGQVLVHCAAGVSRSAMLVMAHLILSNNGFLTPEAALLRVRRVRRVAQPNPGFMQQLRRLYIENADPDAARILLADCSDLKIYADDQIPLASRTELE